MNKAQGWPSAYEGVMLQGFYWDSFIDSKWSNLEKEADELSNYFSLIWVPQSGNCIGTSMGYNDIYWYNHNSSFGSEQELRSMIATFKTKGVGIIEDVVINHRCGVNSWTDFPKETYKDNVYEMFSSDICSTDECVKNGYEATGAPDTGDDFDGCRDLDHSSQNVQKNVNAYLDFLLNDLGYSGFRYDLVKGYSPSFTRLYNQHSQPTFSVGEYFDGSYDKVIAWIDGTKDNNGQPHSAAFDFPNKFCLNAACNNGEWNKLMWVRNGTLDQPAGLIHMDLYKRYAVTFVDNHDTFRDNNKIFKNVEAANAFILSMPGTPCVFLPHWKNYKNLIKQLIIARKTAGISNESEVKVLSSTSTVFAAKVQGTHGKLYLKVGNGSFSMPTTATSIITGNNFQVALDKDNNTIWCNRASGTYDKGTSISLNKISENADAVIYFTTDGTTPSSTNGEIWTNSTVLNINEPFTLKAILSTTEGSGEIIERNFNIKKPFVSHTATFYVKATWENMYFYAWDNNNKQLLGSWPGQQITNKKVINGEEWYYYSFDINDEDQFINLVLNQGSNINQTTDIVGLTSDHYFTISENKENGKYPVIDQTNEITSIKSYNTQPITIRTGKGKMYLYSKTNSSIMIHSIAGNLIKNFKLSNSARTIVLPAGIYLVNNKKVLVK